ncbi:hypothetical protein SCHPADRAFT_902236 [Schizopora paradoxa]|uniref:Uncharacterized protein n=1 Tax=Schizopora paradoxa TaxID=27342 RepID=A0A0H2SEW5_9AGAM|nr:hypothetical protein SCHPADRAFT_902236 [Schizopora paradoxa]
MTKEISRRGRFSTSRRQANLVYQSGGLLIDDDGRQIQALQSSSSIQELLTSPVSSTPALTVNAGIDSSTGPSSIDSLTQITTSTQISDVPPSLSAQQAAQQSFLIAPTTLVTLSSESSTTIPMTSTSPSTTTSLSLHSTSSHMTSSSSSSSTPFSLSTPSSLLPASHQPTSTAYVILPASSSSTAYPSASVGNLSTSNHHPTEFYIGIAFLAVVVAALCISIVAWFFRTRKRGLKCCFSRDKGGDDDMEKQDLGFGLGFYVGGSSSSVAKIASSTTFGQNSRASHTTYSPYSTTKPAQAYLGSAESFVPSFGALHIKNLVPGDVHSSGDEMSRETSRVGCELGTPREEIPGSTPRFLALDGMGLDVPWSPIQLRSTCSPSHVSVLQSPSRRSLSAKEERVRKNWEGLPPLPAPTFAHDTESSKAAVQEGWGATIRSGLRSALSAMTGGQTGKTSPPVDDDHFTSLPSRPSRSNLSQSRSFSSRRRPQSRASAREDPFQDIPINDEPVEYSHKPFGPGAGFFGDFTHEVAQSMETLPLVIRKKSHAIGRLGSNDLRGSRVILSPGGIYRARSPDFQVGIPVSISSPVAGGKHPTMPIRSSLSQSTRPTVLKRGSTSGFSDASLDTEASQVLTEEELAVKRVMRSRRQTASALEGHF